MNFDADSSTCRSSRNSNSLAELLQQQQSEIEQMLEEHPDRPAFEAQKEDEIELIISRHHTPKSIPQLVENSLAYENWLRLTMMRLLTRTPALGMLKKQANFELAQVSDFLGFENFEKFVAKRMLTDIRNSLEFVLQRMEIEYAGVCAMPEVLQTNLQALAEVVGLTQLEKEILGLIVLIHGEVVLENCSELAGGMAGYTLQRVIAPMLNQSVEAVSSCLDRGSALATSGLLRIDMNGRYNMRELTDLLTNTFANRMLSPQKDIRQVVEGFVRPSPKSSLTVKDYEHVQSKFEICQRLLCNTKSTQGKGVNILIYGQPGTGKTQFSRMLADALGLDLMEICTANLAGAPVVPARRLRNYRITQAFFKSVPTLVLFDECEEVLNRVKGSDRNEDEASIPRKSWINNMLETNEVPTIWIANSISGFDEAYLRRFHVCFEMPYATQEHRARMLASVFDGQVRDDVIHAIARHQEASPAVLAQTASVLKLVSGQEPMEQREKIALELINGTLKAQALDPIVMKQRSGITGEGYNPDWVNSSVDLKPLAESIKACGSARLCLYGPPGTGKTAFGEWLAQQCGKPHLVMKASDILRPHVGETEQMIAEAFEQAKQTKAVLQFDEVDSMLQDRSGDSLRQWEITQVNEMLVQMERFEGVFIASTNLMDRLDEASLRRFDMSIKFDFLKAQTAQEVFERTCKNLSLDPWAGMNPQDVSTMDQLTTGDFEQFVRQTRLVSPQSASDVLNSLKKAVALKKTKAQRSIGFTSKV